MSLQGGRPAARPTAAAAAVAIVCVLAGGCGAKPPQAPPGQANRVASALGEIAAACGESFQQAGGGAHGPSAGVRSAAAERVTELAHVYARGPGWIYQGKTLREVVARTIGYLRECGLPGPAAELDRAVRGG